MSVRILTGVDAMGRTYVSRKKVRPPCLQCGGEITRRGSAVKFCSHKCYGDSIKGQPKPPEQVAARAVPRGEAHTSWAGDAVSEKGGRKRALRLYPQIGPCRRCGAHKAERHHIDGDTANNVPDNIEALCRRCHMEADGRLAALHDARRGAACR